MKPPKPDHIAIRQLIRRLANTPDGFCQADAHGMPGAQCAANSTNRMIASGDLVRVKVPGHLLHFVKTQAMADALTLALLAGKPKRIRAAVATPPRIPQCGPLRQFILLASATPEGVSHAQAAHAASCLGAFGKCVQSLIDTGKLYRAKVKGHRPQFFAREVDARAWETNTPEHVMPRKARPVRVKIAKPAAHKPVPIVIRKAYSPPAPRADAVIVWPARMPECRMMPAPRNQVITHSFIHGGMGAM